MKLFLWVLLMIFIVILIISIIYAYPKDFYEFIGMHNRPVYRLGDMFMYSEIQRKFNLGGKYYHLKHFSDSVASEYMKKTTKKADYDTLHKIIIQRSKNIEVPILNELVIHLRLGDVIDNSPYSVEELLQKQRAYITPYSRSYVKPMSYYEDILDKIKDYNIHHITLVGGVKNKKNDDYVSRIKEFFERNGYRVELRISNNFEWENADDDFLYMCNSKFFVPSGGNFSKIICELVNRNNNKCFNI